VGVVNDFHHLSLQNQETPSAFQFGGRDFREFEYYLVKLNTSRFSSALPLIQSAWMNNFKDNPFEFTFLDESFNQQYRNDIQFGIIFGIFSLLAISIACIGLFALVAFMIRQRTREIGVRKVLGAGIGDILLLLTKDFIRLIVIANLIAWPLGWLLMSDWLKDFAYRIHINLLVFILSGCMALLIAIITISFQAIRAALANPVNSLRAE
jgi:putative ABC transport system permease protein